MQKADVAVHRCVYLTAKVSRFQMESDGTFVRKKKKETLAEQRFFFSPEAFCSAFPEERLPLSSEDAVSSERAAI